MDFLELRHHYHQEICRQVLGLRSGVLNIADRSSKKSTQLAQGILEKLQFPPCAKPPVGQRAGA